MPDEEGKSKQSNNKIARKSIVFFDWVTGTQETFLSTICQRCVCVSVLVNLGRARHTRIVRVLATVLLRCFRTITSFDTIESEAKEIGESEFDELGSA